MPVIAETATGVAKAACRAGACSLPSPENIQSHDPEKS
jgi:hypothetical protein